MLNVKKDKENKDKNIKKIKKNKDKSKKLNKNGNVKLN